jgi:hypothetical protein
MQQYISNTFIRLSKASVYSQRRHNPFMCTDFLTLHGTCVSTGDKFWACHLLCLTNRATYFKLGIFHWHNPSGRTMSLGSTQPLTEMSTRNISWGLKAAGAYGWQTYHLHVPIVLKSGSLNLLEPSGPVQVCNGIMIWYIYLTAVGLTPGGSSTSHIYTQTVRITQR